MRFAAVAGWVDELASAPHVVGHGDACPNNLLGAERPDAFVMIDFGFWKPLPLGFDLGQLLLGDVQIGRRSADDLAAIDAEIVAAYVEGFADESHRPHPAQVARLHALQMAVFTGLSSMPFEHLGAPPAPRSTSSQQPEPPSRRTASTGSTRPKGSAWSETAWPADECSDLLGE